MMDSSTEVSIDQIPIWLERIARALEESNEISKAMVAANEVSRYDTRAFSP